MISHPLISSFFPLHCTGNKLSRQETHALQVQLWESLRGGLKELSKYVTPHIQTHTHRYMQTHSLINTFIHASTDTVAYTKSHLYGYIQTDVNSLTHSLSERLLTYTYTHALKH